MRWKTFLGYMKRIHRDYIIIMQLQWLLHHQSLVSLTASWSNTDSQINDKGITRMDKGVYSHCNNNKEQGHEVDKVSIIWKEAVKSSPDSCRIQIKR